MKILLLLVFSSYFLSGVNTYVVQKVDGVRGDVQLIEFDSDGNAYVFSYNNADGYLYKLNSTGHILWTITNSDYDVTAVFATGQNIVYLSLLSLGVEYTSIGIIREDTVTIEEIIDTDLPEPIFLDEEDKLFYNGFDGINMLRPGKTVPVVIENLENSFSRYGDKGAAVDIAGDVYFGVENGSSPSISIAVVTNDAKHEEIPTATFFDLSDAIYLEHLLVDERNSIWAFIYGHNHSLIQKISSGNIQNIFTDDTFTVSFALAVKDRIYFAPQYEDYEETSGLYITLDGHVEKIPELVNISRSYFTYSQAVADKEGNVYIGIYFAYPGGQVLAVRPDDQKNIWIKFPRAIRVKFLILDNNDDLWIVGDGEGVYVLKKGETIPTEVVVPPDAFASLRAVNVNKFSNEVYLASFRGLFAIKNNSN